MHRILVPVDFSANAESAFSYALHLAAGLPIQLLVLLHVQKPDPELAEGLESVPPEVLLSRMTEAAETRLGEDVTVLAKVLKGIPEEVIERLATQFEADLIVMGACGQGQASRHGQFLGSVSGTMFKHTELPLLFVPAGTAFISPVRIAFIMKSLLVHKPGVLKPLIDLATAFAAEISVVQIKASSLEESYGKESNLNFGDVPHNLYQLTCEQVPEGIERVIRTFDPQILCVIRRRRDFFESLFKARSIAANDFNSSVPVLVLQGVR